MIVFFFIFAQMRVASLYNDFNSGRMEMLYSEFFPALIMYASKILGPEYSYLSEDCVQESIFKTYERRESIGSESALKSYLYTAVRNNALSILRKGHSKSNYLKQVEMSEQDIHNQMFEQETMRLLYVAIDKLPEEYRTVFDLNFKEGLHNAEIAALLGISESTVKRRKSKIIQSLLREIEDPEVKIAPILIFAIISSLLN